MKQRSGTKCVNQQEIFTLNSSLQNVLSGPDNHFYDVWRGNAKDSDSQDTIEILNSVHKLLGERLKSMRIAKADTWTCEECPGPVATENGILSCGLLAADIAIASEICVTEIESDIA